MTIFLFDFVKICIRISKIDIVDILVQELEIYIFVKFCKIDLFFIQNKIC